MAGSPSFYWQSGIWQWNRNSTWNRSSCLQVNPAGFISHIPKCAKIWFSRRMMIWMLLSKLFATWCHLCAWMWMPVVVRCFEAVRFPQANSINTHTHSNRNVRNNLSPFVSIPIFLGSFFWGGFTRSVGKLRGGWDSFHNAPWHHFRGDELGRIQSQVGYGYRPCSLASPAASCQGLIIWVKGTDGFNAKKFDDDSAPKNKGLKITVHRK